MVHLGAQAVFVGVLPILHDDRVERRLRYQGDCLHLCNLCDLGPSIGEKYGIPVIEDAAGP